MISKTCTKCRATKPLDDFYKSARNKQDGRQDRCADCQMNYQKKNRDEAKGRSATWRKKKGVTPRPPRANVNQGPGTLFPDKE